MGPEGSFRQGFKDSYAEFDNSFKPLRGEFKYDAFLPIRAVRTLVSGIFEVVIGFVYAPKAFYDGGSAAGWWGDRTFTVHPNDSTTEKTMKFMQDEENPVNELVLDFLAIDSISSRKIGEKLYFAFSWSLDDVSSFLQKNNTYIDFGDEIRLRLNDDKGTGVKIMYISSEDLAHEAIKKLDPDKSVVTLKGMLFDIVESPSENTFSVTKDDKTYYLALAKYSRVNTNAELPQSVPGSASVR